MRFRATPRPIPPLLPTTPRQPPLPDATSDRWRYADFRSREIEYYKEVVEYRALMRLVDVARERMHSRGELVLGDLTLAAEVDELVAERLRLPTFRSWSRTQARTAGQRHPWSARSQLFAQQLSQLRGGAPVLLLQPRASDVWEALCADGTRVVLVEPDADDRGRVMARAASAGVEDLVQVLPSHEDAGDDATFSSVLLSASACADMLDWETAALLQSLKARTIAGGVHIVDGLLVERASAPRHVLRSAYGDWQRRVERGPRGWTLIARQGAPALRL